MQSTRKAIVRPPGPECGSGISVQGTKYRVQGSGFGFRVEGTRFKVQGKGYRVQSARKRARAAQSPKVLQIVRFGYLFKMVLVRSLEAYLARVRDQGTGYKVQG